MTGRHAPSAGSRKAHVKVPCEDELRATVLRALKSVAPEMDEGTLDPAIAFRDQIDFDSADYVRYTLALQELLKLEIPDADYLRLGTVDAAVSYLSARLSVAK